MGAPLLAAYPLPRELRLQWSAWANAWFDTGFAAIVSFVLGYMVYGAWRQTEMKLIWLAGAVWFGVGLARASLQPASVLDVYESYKIYGGITRADIELLTTWGAFFTPFIRTSFYSAGALCRQAQIDRRRPPGA